MPKDLHLLCPRQNDDDQDRYEDSGVVADGQQEVDSARSERVGEAKARRKKFISSLQLLAYDGPESEQHQRTIWDKLDNALGRCDICIREYYVAKMDFLTSLREDYEEDDIKTFFDLINRRDVARIVEGLDGARKTLEGLPDQKKGMSALESTHLHAVFEALICDAFLKDEKLLQKHFDEPFKLVQTKKPLRMREVLPATVRFLFDKNRKRLDWASTIWARIERPPTELEWNWAIRDFIQEKLQQLQHSSDGNQISTLWGGLKVIVGKLNEWQITHNLLDLVPNVCKLALDHLARRTPAVPYITQTLASILETAPEAFWQAMGSISSQAIAELVFASPLFNKCLESAVEEPSTKHVLLWIHPFINSLKPANRPAACQTLVTQLFQRVHTDSVSTAAKQLCFEAAVKVMLDTLVSFSDNEKNRQSVERLVLLDTLNTISHRIEELLKPSPAELAERLSEVVRTDVLSTLR